MKPLRSILFWLHLAAGVAAGVIILVMSATGALLALKPQILNAVEKDVRFVTPPVAGSRLGLAALLASVQRARPDARPATVTLQADPAAAAARSTSTRTRGACSATDRRGRSGSSGRSKTGTGGWAYPRSGAPPHAA